MKLVIFFISLQASEIVDKRINKTEIQIMDLKIKQVDTSNEYQEVLKIRKKVFIEEQKISKKIEIDSYEKTSKYIIAFLNNRPVGTARWRKSGLEIKLERDVACWEQQWWPSPYDGTAGSEMLNSHSVPGHVPSR